MENVILYGAGSDINTSLEVIKRGGRYTILFV